MAKDKDEELVKFVNQCVKMIKDMYWHVNDAKDEEDEAVCDGYNMACDDIIFALKNRFPPE